MDVKLVEPPLGTDNEIASRERESTNGEGKKNKNWGDGTREKNGNGGGPAIQARQCQHATRPNTARKKNKTSKG